MTVIDEPLTNGQANGHDQAGRFIKGHKGGPGNKLARFAVRHRTQLLKNVKLEHIDEAYANLMELVRDKDLGAIREFLDRTCGKVKEEDSGDERNKVIQMFLTTVNVNTDPSAVPVRSYTRSKASSAKVDSQVVQTQTKNVDEEHTHNAQTTTQSDAKPPE